MTTARHDISLHYIFTTSNKYKIKIICIYSIAGHEKGEVDHLGGLAKVAFWREIGAGAFFADAEDMVVFLQSNFNEKRDLGYRVKEIDVKQLYFELLFPVYSFLSKKINSQNN